MARKRASKSNGSTASETMTRDALARAGSGAVDQPPAGMRSVQSAQADGYIRPIKGLVVHGILKGRFPRPNNASQAFYQLELIAPTAAAVKDPDNDSEWITSDLPAGSKVNIDERAALKNLAPLASAGSHTVWIKFIDKVALQNGQSFWKTDVYTDAGLDSESETPF